MIRKRLAALFLFLLAAMLLFSFRLRALFDPLQLLLLAVGTALFYLAGGGLSRGKPSGQELGRCALLTGGLEAMVLIVAQLQGEGDFDRWSMIAGNLRPVLYGFCGWIIMGGAPEKKGAEGRQRSVQDCRTYFRQRGLTPRETEVALLVIRDMTNAEIAYELGIAENTVKKHLTSIFEKLGAGSRAQLRRMALSEKEGPKDGRTGE